MRADKRDFVALPAWVPEIRADLRYATADNFLGRPVYGFRTPWLRRGTADKLAGVQRELAGAGLGLLVWDAFRPAAAQFALWELMPDDDYVADPRKGFSNHTRGNTVDVTLVYADGTPVEMPTAFDDFTGAARRDFPWSPGDAAAACRLLEGAMVRGGFAPYIGEWWHFVDRETYPVETDFDPARWEGTAVWSPAERTAGDGL